MAYQRREITLQTRIVVPVNSFKHKVFLDEDKNKYLVTTPGKIILMRFYLIHSLTYVRLLVKY